MFKIDKATGQPTVEPVAIDRFEARLKKLAADQQATFVAYNSATGLWTMEVKHFSK